METNIKTTTLKNFVVIQDGEVIVDTTPTAAELARERLIGSVAKIYAGAKLEARMLVFDVLHGTNYRQIRHDLIKQKRCQEFEQSIGLTPVTKK